MIIYLPALLAVKVKVTGFWILAAHLTAAYPTTALRLVDGRREAESEIR